MPSTMPPLYDHRGNPIDRRLARDVLEDTQSAGIRQLRTQFGTSHPAAGLTPTKLRRILQGAEEGDLQAQAELGADMEERDGHLFAELSKRKRALLTLPWQVVPPRNPSREEEKAAALVGELLQDLPDLEDVFLDMADAIGHGYSCLELEWVFGGGAWLPKAIHWRPQGWFQTTTSEPDTLRLRDGTSGGVELQPLRWITHIHKAKSGYLARAGLHRVLAWPYLFKNYGIRDLAELLEIYGLPLRLGKYPAGATEQDKAALLSAVVNIGHDAGGIIPDQMAIEFQEVSASRADPFVAMVEWCERTQSKAILGGTLTSQADGKTSTNALGNVHNEVRHDILIADARQLAGTLTRYLVHPLAVLNAAGVQPGRSPRFVFDTQEPEDLALYADALPKLAAAGARIPVAWVGRQLNIPEPQDGEPVLGGPPPSATPPSGTAKARREQGRHCPHCTAAAKTGGGLLPDDVDPLVEQAVAAAEPLIEAMVAPLRAAVAEAGSYEELLARLEPLAEAMPGAPLAELVAVGMVVAEQTGRAEVIGGR